MTCQDLILKIFKFIHFAQISCLQNRKECQIILSFIKNYDNILNVTDIINMAGDVIMAKKVSKKEQKLNFFLTHEGLRGKYINALPEEFIKMDHWLIKKQDLISEFSCIDLSRDEEFIIAYELIARYIYYSLLEYRKSRPTATHLYATPITIRRLIYMLIYIKYQNKFGINRNISTVTQQNYCKVVVDSINNEFNKMCQDHNIVGLSSGINANAFTPSKWGFDPYHDFKYGNSYTEPKIRSDYPGKKHKVYGFMQASLVHQCDYSIYAEVFAGSGQGFANIEHREGTIEYLNDFDPTIYNLLLVYRDYYSEFMKHYKRVVNYIEKLSKNKMYEVGNAYICNKAYQIMKTKKNIANAQCDYEKKLNKYKVVFYRRRGAKASDKVKANVRKMRTNYTRSLFGYYEKNYYDNYYDDKYKSYREELKEIIPNIDLAFTKFFLQNFLFSGQSPEISAVTEDKVDSFIKNCKLDDKTQKNDRQIYYFSKRLNQSKRSLLKWTLPKLPDSILNMDASALITSSEVNKSSTLCYLDPPYAGTAGYNVGFIMRDFMKALSVYEGHFIYSCRVFLTATTLKKKDCYDLLDMYRWLRTVGRRTKKELYVLIKTDENSGISKYVKIIVENKSECEIMVTNYKFDPPDYFTYNPKYGGGSILEEHDTLFRCVPYNHFYMAVKNAISITLPEVYKSYKFKSLFKP